MSPPSVTLAYVDLVFKRQCPDAEVSPVEASPYTRVQDHILTPNHLSVYRNSYVHYLMSNR